MSLYQTKTPVNFSVKKSNIVKNALIDEASSDHPSNPQIIYATIIIENGECKIKPIGLSHQGYFEVTQISSTMSFTFICNSPYKKVIGMATVGSDYTFSISQSVDTEFTLTVSGIGSSFFTTISLMVQ